MPFEKGKTGNPSGRPRRGQTFAALLERDLARKHTPPRGQEDERLSRKQAIVRRAVDLALAGDLDALKWIAERTEGKTPNALEVSGTFTHEHRHTLTDQERARRLASLLAIYGQGPGGSDHGADAVALAPPGGATDEGVPE